MRHPLPISRHPLRVLIAACLAGLAGSALADGGNSATMAPLNQVGAPPPGEEQIQVRPTTPQAPPMAAPLAVDFRPVRDSYRVNEPIQFRVSGNREFYLYLYNIDPATGDGILLFPNRYQTANRFHAGQKMLVPGRSVEFVADRVGIEKVTMVASTRPLDLPMERFTAAGPFVRGPVADFDEALRVRPVQALGPEQVVLQPVELSIVGSRPDWYVQPAPAVGELPTVFVSTPEPAYHAGERMPVVFGADRDGWIQLYAIGPDGSNELLGVHQVFANQAQTLRVRARAPFGDHRLVAIYSPDGLAQDRLLADITEGRFAGIVAGSDDADLGVAVFVVRMLAQ